MFQFTDDCLIGVPNIDNEHRKLFELLTLANEQLLVSNDALPAVVALLKELKVYAATHFIHEEAYMEEINDPELPRQKQEHQAFIEKVNSYDIDALTKESGKEIAIELLNFLAKWLYRHILGSDILIGKIKAEEISEDPFAFSDKYKTNIDSIDEEHKRLFELIKETNDTIHAELLYDKYDQIIHIITGLKEYTLLHFANEEAYMKKIGYSGLLPQKIAHQAFIDRLNNIDLDEIDDNQQEYLEELISYLLDWLVNHILKMDKLIG